MPAIKNISLYIPHVFPNLDREFLTEQFSQVGDVNHIDMVLKQDKDGKSYNAVYVHFNSWFDDIETIEFQQEILNPEQEARFYYDGPWYWIVLPNNTKKVVSSDRKTRIDLGGSKSINSGSFSTPEKAENSFIPVPPLVRKTNAASRATMPLTPRNLISEFETTEEYDCDGFRISPLDWSNPVYTYTRNDFDNMEEIDIILTKDIDNEQYSEFLSFVDMDMKDLDEILNQMDEVDDIMDADMNQDIHLAHYDSRYVNALENENADLRKDVEKWKDKAGIYEAILNKYRARGYI